MSTPVISFTIVGRLPIIESIWEIVILNPAFSEQTLQMQKVSMLSLKSFKPVSAPTSSVILLAPTGPSPVLTIVILSVSARGALTSAATRGRTWFERKKVCCLGLNVFLFLSLIKYQGKSGVVFFKDVSQLP